MTRHHPREIVHRSSEPLWRLCYRFLWPFQYFRDVTCGSTLERQLNYRHNRAMRVFLPGFVVKWSALTALWFACGGFFDHGLELVVPAACCYMTATWALIVVVKLTAAWMWLERFPELF
jgi:hypothetical protein